MEGTQEKPLHIPSNNTCAPRSALAAPSILQMRGSIKLGDRSLPRWRRRVGFSASWPVRGRARGRSRRVSQCCWARRRRGDLGAHRTPAQPGKPPTIPASPSVTRSGLHRSRSRTTSAPTTRRLLRLRKVGRPRHQRTYGWAGTSAPTGGRVESSSASRSPAWSRPDEAISVETLDPDLGRRLSCCSGSDANH